MKNRSRSVGSPTARGCDVSQRGESGEFRRTETAHPSPEAWSEEGPRPALCARHARSVCDEPAGSELSLERARRSVIDSQRSQGSSRARPSSLSGCNRRNSRSRADSRGSSNRPSRIPGAMRDRTRTAISGSGSLTSAAAECAPCGDSLIQSDYDSPPARTRVNRAPCTFLAICVL